jgi:hypothetical protein
VLRARLFGKPPAVLDMDDARIDVCGDARLLPDFPPEGFDPDPVADVVVSREARAAPGATMPAFEIEAAPTGSPG